MHNRIEKEIRINAPAPKVWRALTDYRQFGEWFGVKIDGPFVAGQPATGQMLIKGVEHMRWNVIIEKIQPETLFSFRWHPYAMDESKDYSQEKMTLVEFTLHLDSGGTLLKVVESGFEHLPEERREEAQRMNDGGWAFQIKNIEAYVTKST